MIPPHYSSLIMHSKENIFFRSEITLNPFDKKSFRILDYTASSNSVRLSSVGHEIFQRYGY
jgi:hypothetical protein